MRRTHEEVPMLYYTFVQFTIAGLSAAALALAIWGLVVLFRRPRIR